MRRFFRPLALGAVLGVGCAPAVTVRPAVDGATTFTVRTDAAAVSLLGTMTGWRPLALARRDAGFELTMRVPRGRYEYRLVAQERCGDRVVWPDEVERTPDGFGGENAVLRVP